MNKTHEIKKQPNRKPDDEEKQASLKKRNAGLLGLQKKVGNQAVQRLIAQRKSKEGFTLNDQTGYQIQKAKQSGQALDADVKQEMEQQIGQPLRDVHIHADSQADELNQQLGARAFTIGKDVFFREGTYDPRSQTGRELLAHELTHVHQQASGKVGKSEPGLNVRPAGDQFEQEADAVAKQAVKASAGDSAPAGHSIQRYDQWEVEQQQTQDPTLGHDVGEREMKRRKQSENHLAHEGTSRPAQLAHEAYSKPTGSGQVQAPINNPTEVRPTQGNNNEVSQSSVNGETETAPTQKPPENAVTQSPSNSENEVTPTQRPPENAVTQSPSNSENEATPTQKPPEEAVTQSPPNSETETTPIQKPPEEAVTQSPSNSETETAPTQKPPEEAVTQSGQRAVGTPTTVPHQLLGGGGIITHDYVSSSPEQRTQVREDTGVSQSHSVSQYPSEGEEEEVQMQPANASPTTIQASFFTPFENLWNSSGADKVVDKGMEYVPDSVKNMAGKAKKNVTDKVGKAKKTAGSIWDNIGNLVGDKTESVGDIINEHTGGSFNQTEGMIPSQNENQGWSQNEGSLEDELQMKEGDSEEELVQCQEENPEEEELQLSEADAEEELVQPKLEHTGNESIQMQGIEEYEKLMSGRDKLTESPQYDQPAFNKKEGEIPWWKRWF